MLAKLEFDLNDKDDENRHLACVKSMDMARVLYDMRETFLKHLSGKRVLTDRELEEFCEQIYECGIGEFYV
jgi:hypothetical protein